MKWGKLLLLASMFIIVASSAGQSYQEKTAAEEFQSLTRELQARSRTASPAEFIPLVEKELNSFIEKYPGTEEAAKAELTLGQFFMQIGRTEEAVTHLKNFLDSGHLQGTRESTAAGYSLAECYIKLENYDRAEYIFNSLLRGGNLDPKVKSMVTQKLAELGILRRLALGKEAINFSAQTSSGKKISLEDYRGKVVLLDFWASWCMPCKQEMPTVKKVYDKYHQQGFEIIGISLDESREKFKSYIQKENISWPQIFDGKSGEEGIARKYAVSTIPTTFLIDREGKIADKNMRGEQLEKAVGNLMEIE